MITCRLIHKLILMISTAFVLITIQKSAYAFDSISGIVADQISQQVSKNIAESVYGHIVRAQLKVEATAGKLKQARYLQKDKLLFQHFTNGTHYTWDMSRGVQLAKHKVSKSATPVFYDRKKQLLYVQEKSSVKSINTNGKSITLSTSNIPAAVNRALKQPQGIKTPSGKSPVKLAAGKLAENGKSIDNNVAYAAFIDNQHYIYVKKDGLTYLRKLGLDYYLISIVPGKAGWVVVDHEGRFDGTVAGTRDVHWNAGKDRLSLDQFFDAYYQAGLLASYVNRSTSDLRKVPSKFKQGIYLPPKVEMDLPDPKMKAGQVFKVVTVAESRGGELDKNLNLYHNGKRLPSKALIATQIVKKANKFLVIGVFAFTPTHGPNEIYAMAANQHGVASRSKVIKQVTSGKKSGGKLHIVGIGVDRYKNSDLNLDFAVADTSSVVENIKNQSGKVYKKIALTKLTDQKATRKGITKLLKGLEKLSANDSVILSLAGHGVYQDGEWYFLPHDVNVNRIEKSSISARELQDYLVQSPAQNILLLVDACNSGGGIDSFNRYKNFQRRFVQQMGRSAGIAVLTASRRDQFAFEAPQIGHGLFTYTVLDGLKGNADTSPKDGNISAHEIAKYVSDNMKAKGTRLLAEAQILQDPTHFVIGSDFVIGRK